jgi:hypothetical protein
VILYQGNPIPFPSDFVSPKDKLEQKWQRLVAQSIWYRYCSGATAWGYQDRQAMQLKRLYSNGQQPDAKYRDSFDGEAKADKNVGKDGSILHNYARTGYANVDYSIDSPAPTFKATIQSVLSNSDYRVLASSISPTLLKKKRKQKAEIYFDSQYKELYDKVGKPRPKLPWTPQNKEEIELYEKLGGIKLTFEMAIEDITQHTFDHSNWKRIRNLGIEDEIDLNFVCGKVYTCYKTGATKIKHVAPQNLIMSWVDEDSDRPTFVGHLEKVRLSDVRAQLLAEGYSEDQVMQAAQTYWNASPSDGRQPWEYFRQYDPNTERWRWEDLTVDVMEYEYCSLDTEYYTKRQTKDGSVQFFPDDEREEKKPYADGRMRKTDKIPIQTIYEGKFIVGTQIVYDYGRQQNIMKDDVYSCHSSYFFERITGKSITDRLIPVYDSLMLGRLKLQAAKWAAAPKGISVDVAALSNIKIGDTIMQPMELIKIRRQNGVQVYKSVIQQGKVITNANSIQELEGGIGVQLQEWIVSYQHDYQRALELSGISEMLMAGPAASGEKGLGVSQIEIDATNHALYPLRDGLRGWKEKAAKCIVMKTMLNIRFDDKCRTYWTGVIGPEKVAAIMEVGDTTLEQLSITLESLPSESQKRLIVEGALQARDAAKSGAKGITQSDFMYIVDLIEKGQVKLATWYMAVAEERNHKRNIEEQTAMQQQNAKMMAESAMQAEQAKVQSEQILSQFRIQEHKAKAQIDTQKELAILQIKGKDAKEIQAMKGEQAIAEITTEATLEAALGTELSGRV